MRRACLKRLLLTCFLAVIPLVSIAKGDGGVFLQKAEVALKDGALMNAVNLLQQARALSPDDPGIPELEKRLREAINESVAASLREGDFYLNTKQFPKALAAYKKVLMVDPSNQQAKARIAEIKLMLAKVEKYRKSGIKIDGQTGRAFDPSMYSAMSLLAKAREAYDKKNYETALRLVEEILAREKGLGEAKKLRDEIVQKMKLRDLALEVEKFQDKSEFDAAAAQISMAIELTPDDGNLYLWRGKVFLQAKRFSDAKADFLAARTHGIPFERIRLPLADSFFGLKNYRKAYALGTHRPGFGEKKDRRFLLLSYLYSFPQTVLFFVCSCLFFFFGFWWFGRQVGQWLEFRSGNLLWKTGRFMIGAVVFGKVRDCEEGIDLALCWNLPWFYYLGGLICYSEGRFEEALVFFQSSLNSDSLQPRALFFLGLTHLEHSGANDKMAVSRLEEMLIEGMRKRPKPWIPRFLSRLEEPAGARGISLFPSQDPTFALCRELAFSLGLKV